MATSESSNTGEDIRDQRDFSLLCSQHETENPRVTCSLRSGDSHVFPPLLFPPQFAPKPDMRGKKG